MVDVKIGLLSIIDIYSGGGVKVVAGRFLGCKCISQAKLHCGKPPNGKRQVGIRLAFFLLFERGRWHAVKVLPQAAVIFLIIISYSCKDFDGTTQRKSSKASSSAVKLGVVTD